MISVYCYSEALVEAILRLQVFTFVVSGGKTCLYSKGILRERAVTFSAPNRITRGGTFSDIQEIWREDPYSNPLWCLVLHAWALLSHEISHIHGSQDFWIRPPDGHVLQGLDNPPVAPMDLCMLKHDPEAKQLARWEVHAYSRAKRTDPHWWWTRHPRP